MKKIFLTCIMLTWSLSLFAGEIYLDDISRGERSIQEEIALYLDRGGMLTLKDIHSGKIADQFWHNSDRVSNLGYSSDALWIRVRLKKARNLKKRWFLKLAYPHIDIIDFYAVRKDGSFTYMKTGDALPFSSRRIENRNFIFPLETDSKEYTIYLRLKSSGALNFPLSIIDSHSYYRQDHREQIIYGIIFGTLIIMILYNIFIFFSVRERVYIFYVAHIFFLILFLAHLSGYSDEYITRDFPSLNNILDLFSVFGALFTVGLFIQAYLETRKIVPRLDKVLLVLTFLSGICMVFSAFGGRKALLYFSSILPIAMMIAALSISFIAVRKNIRQAWFFIFAWGILIVATSLIALSRLGGLEQDHADQYVFAVGLVFNVVFLSLGLADRINSMRNQLRELNIDLEQKVKSRTNDLEDALAEIETTNEHLQERNSELTRTQRIARKDMAMAINVQNSFLPNMPPESKDWDIAFMYQPMVGISGDFYDFYVEDNTLKGAGIFDVSGHGIASGLITMIAKSVIFRNFMKGQDLPLHEVMKITNAELQHEIGDVGNYITGALLRFRENSIEYANAAHTDIMIKNGGEVYLPEEKFNKRIAGAFLGIVGFDYEYESIEFELTRGDCIFLYTDGLNEARNGEEEIYSLKRIAASFKKAPDASAQEILNHIILDYHDFMKDVIEQQDDITLVVLRKR